MKRRRILNRSHCLKASVHQYQWFEYSNSPGIDAYTGNNSKLITDLHRGLQTGYNFLCYIHTVYLTSLSHWTDRQLCYWTDRQSCFSVCQMYCICLYISRWFLKSAFSGNGLKWTSRNDDITAPSQWRRNEKPQCRIQQCKTPLDYNTILTHSREPYPLLYYWILTRSTSSHSNRSLINVFYDRQQEKKKKMIMNRCVSEVRQGSWFVCVCGWREVALTHLPNHQTMSLWSVCRLQTLISWCNTCYGFSSSDFSSSPCRAAA